MNIVPGTDDHYETCIGIAASLPDHFSGQGLEQMAADLRDHGSFVVLLDKRPIGFLCYSIGDEPEILWMGVSLDLQRQGVGRALIDYLMSYLRESGIDNLTVRTLAPTEGDESYRGTRRFYEDLGFVHVETIDQYPGWGSGNPCAVYTIAL
jgi:GNAT superfamily N-acetyltransferase